MTLYNKIINSRYGWLIQGLPDIGCSIALYKVKRNTMTTAIRCKTLWKLCIQAIDRDIKGDFVECGVWMGGSAGVMALAILHKNSNKLLHLYDSFEGLPEPRIEDGDLATEYSGGANSGQLKSLQQCVASIDSVKDFLFSSIRYKESQARFHVGWFQETLPNSNSRPDEISVLRLDGDWYESTKVCLDNLYDRVSKGGFIILDDYYAWEGCKKATDEFRSSRGIQSEIKRIDVDSAYWVKE